MMCQKAFANNMREKDISHTSKELRCKECGKYYFAEIRDWNKCDKFIAKHKDKFWSGNCQPVL